MVSSDGGKPPIILNLGQIGKVNSNARRVKAPAVKVFVLPVIFLFLNQKGIFRTPQ